VVLFCWRGTDLLRRVADLVR